VHSPPIIGKPGLQPIDDFFQPIFMTESTTQPSPAQTAQALIKELQARFSVFRDYQPLAIGIDKQIRAAMPEIEKKTLRTALGIHANSLRYLKAMETATERFDLEGNSAGEVTEEHRQHASETLRERSKKNAERRKAQREAEAKQRKAEAEAQRHAEKLNQLAEKFNRK
jgi:ProP effector